MHFFMLRLSRSRGAQVTRQTYETDHATMLALEGSRTFVRHTNRGCVGPLRVIVIAQKRKVPQTGFASALARSTTSYGAFLVLRSEGRLLERDGPRTARHSISGADPID